MATIGAVSLVCAFLCWVVVPLFADSNLTNTGAAPLAVAAPPLLFEVDPYQQVALQLDRGGNARLLALATGAAIDTATLGTAAPVALAAHDERVAIGTADGDVAIWRLGVAVEPIPAARLPDTARVMAPGTASADGTTWLERTATDARRYTLRRELQGTLSLGRAAHRLDLAEHGDTVTLAVVTVDGRLELRAVERRVNPFTDAVETDSRGSGHTLAELGLGPSLPDRVLTAGTGDNIYLVWDDGRCARIDSRDLTAPKLAESLRLLDDGAAITATAFLIGRNTLLVGDDRGRVGAWFRTKPANARGTDGSQLERAHAFATADAPVAAFAVSRRARLFAIGHRDGVLALCHATSQRRAANARIAAGTELRAVALAPKDDGLVALGADRMQRFAIDLGHPEFSLSAVALPVFYEGYERPEHVWQSTSGTDDFEPKFGLWPLVFGTLKATFYCLLFGVPIALLAAIYTSEFLHPRARARIKPLVESMASLPSVVLGFLAALVFAPVVEQWLATVLAAFVAVPLCWCLGAQLVQSLPPQRRLAAERHRLLGAAIALPLGLLLANRIGALAETLLFGGDLRTWLADPDRSHGAFGGWLLLALPAGALVAAWALGRSSWCRSHRHAGSFRLGAGALAALGVAAVLAAGPTACGFDLRGNLVDTYVQRNALVVGFVMAFAVIPIVYTIAEDALAAVPSHLRAASLGAGATPWQTAVRIVLPTAMSGIFSAVMVGLGRAVGETMIVLMAAGNTPVLELNPFNGFRTLSANIAVELPEAVRDSTHYRMLYLAALVLFALTFALNTLAEVVRQRFRERAWQL